jgi:hypothetical protein
MGTPPNEAAGVDATDTVRRDLYRNGLSDRTRTMCVGALVLIWGLLTQKQDEINLSAMDRRSLMRVAVTVVVVLGLDLAEYVMGYFAALPLDMEPSEKATPWRRLRNFVLNIKWVRWTLMRVATPLAFESMRKILLAVKLSVGGAALVCLCFILLRIAPVQAQTRDGEEFRGDWCYGPSGEYVCLTIVRPPPTDALFVIYSVEEPPFRMECQSHFDGEKQLLSASCGALEFIEMRRIPGAIETTRVIKGTGESKHLIFLKH